jgi:hypothetical protein
MPSKPQKPKPSTSSGHRKDPAAVSLGAKGGVVGGPARADALTPEQRHKISLKAAQARWQKAGKSDKSSKGK